MKNLEKIIHQILSLENYLEKESNKLNEEQSTIDTYRELILHNYFESSRVNASLGYKYYAETRDVQLKRRMIKNDASVLKSFLSRYKNLIKDINIQISENETENENILKSLSNQKIIKENVECIDKLLKQNPKTNQHRYNIQRLNNVNKTNIKFKEDKYLTRIEELFEQIKQC